MKNKIPIKTAKQQQVIAKPTTIWINPLGGLGDTLMLSGVLKQLFDRNPNERFNLVRRTKYLSILKNHPAIKEVGYPPEGSKIVTNAYWAAEKLGAGKQRAYQILARTFGLKTPIEEKLYIPEYSEQDGFLEEVIPWKKKNILIAPFSESPRKSMHPMAWHHLVERLTSQGLFIVQVGKIYDIHIKGSYSLLGLTNPKQLIQIMKKFDAIVTTDNFIMHAAHLLNKKTLAIWGPTSADIYGYSEQKHISADLSHCPHKDSCLGPDYPDNYSKPCPLNEHHCMNKISIDEMYNNIQNML